MILFFFLFFQKSDVTCLRRRFFFGTVYLYILICFFFFSLFLQHMERAGAVGSASDLGPRGPRFDSRPGRRLLWP